MKENSVSEKTWLKHLLPEQLAWRKKQILKGRDPDPHILKQLREAGVLPDNGQDDVGATD